MQLNKTKEKAIEDIQKELKDKTISHPFDDDLLGLKSFAETISNIVISTKDPFVFSINSPYGTGKTFFLRRLHCLLEQKGCLCVSYNAWESDFYDNPLPAIINALERRTTTQKVVDMGKQTIKNLSKMKINPLKKFIEEFSILFEKREKIYDDFKKYQEAKEKFIKNLDNFVKKKKKKFVFIIDELDRCRPDYAIKTLETIKHFFNIPNVIFIIGVDRKQIESTVKVLYGTNIDNNCDEYLRKFIDQDFYLPQNATEQYISFLCKKHLTETLNIFVREYIADYRLHLRSTKIYSIVNLNTLVEPMNDIKNVIDNKILVSSLSKNIIRIIVEYVCALSEFFRFSLRTQEQSVLFLKLFFQSLDKDTDFLYPELACILTAIRLNDYNDILSINITDYFNIIINSKDKNLLSEKEQGKLEKLENKSNGKISRSLIDALIEKAQNKNMYATNLFVIWRDFLSNYENATRNYRFSFSLDSIKRYLELVQHITILTTENE